VSAVSLTLTSVPRTGVIPETVAGAEVELAVDALEAAAESPLAAGGDASCFAQPSAAMRIAASVAIELSVVRAIRLLVQFMMRLPLRLAL